VPASWSRNVLHNQTRNDCGGTFGGDVPVALVIIRTEIATTCMRDDVIMVNIHVVNSMWLEAVIERKA
jgi:hypothetical protein